MPTNAAELAKDVKRFFGELLPDQVVDAQRKLTLDFISGAILLAAVDTGRMRGSIRAWAKTPEYHNDDPSGDVSKGSAIRAEELSRSLKALSDLKPGDSCGASCGVEYASYVEEGTERMAAQPFWAPNIARIQKQVRRLSPTWRRSPLSTQLLGE